MHQGKIDSYGVDKRYLAREGAIVWGGDCRQRAQGGDGGSIDYCVSCERGYSARYP